MWDWQKMLSQISNRRINWYVWNELYNMGLRPNRYPVPAIRQHFEFGWCLNTSEPVLMHCVQGPYSD